MTIDHSSSVSQKIAHFERLAEVEKAGVESMQPKVRAQPTATPDQLRASVTQELRSTSHASFVGRSEAAWGKLGAHNPAIREAIAEFTRAHPEKMELLQQKSWSTLKKELDVGMTTPRDSDNISMEEFRQQANQFVAGLVSQASRDMGLPEVAWSASGTAGFNSDVDTAMFSKQPLTLDQQYTLKFLRDSAHAAVFKGLSGTQLDTESYTPHVALSNTAKHLTLPEFQQQFTTSECAMGILQAKVSMLNHAEGWTEFCDRELANTPPERQEATQQMMKAAEEWHDNMQYDTLKQVLIENPTASVLEGLPPNPTVQQLRAKVDGMAPGQVKQQAGERMEEDPEAFKRAGLNIRAPVMLQLASNKGALEQRLNDLQEQLQKLRENNPADPQIATLTHEFEQGLIDADVTQKMLNSLQDEGTFGQGEGNVTLFREGGQIDAGSRAKVHKEFKSEAEKLESIIKSNRMQANLDVQDLRETVRASRPQRAAPSPQELTLAAYEEQQQFEHVIHDGLHKCETAADPAKAAAATAINAGKYCLRTTRNKLRAMEQVERDYRATGRELPPGFGPLKGAMKSAADAALELEQCKRKFTLNRSSAIELLSDAIISSGNDKAAAAGRTQVAHDVASMLNKLDAKGALSDDTLLKREKMNELVHELEQLGYMGETVTLTPEVAASIGNKTLPKDDGMRAVLEGMVGYSRVSTKRDHADLNPLFAAADRITAEKLSVGTAEEVREFAGWIEELSHSWQNMSFQMGVLTPMASGGWVAESMNFNQIWQEAKQQTFSRTS